MDVIEGGARVHDNGRMLLAVRYEGKAIKELRETSNAARPGLILHHRTL